MKSNTRSIKFKGPKLFEWQKAVTDITCSDEAKGKTIVVKAPRQRGKSYVCLGVLLWYCLNKAKTTSAMVSPTLAQSRKVFKEITKSSSAAIARKNETLLEIEFINGSSIFFKSAEQRDNLRGYSVNGVLILDEAAYMTDDILQLILPWRQVSNCPMLIVSTPRIKEGFFFHYYQDGLLPNTGIVTIDWCDWDTSEMISPDLLKQYKKVLTKNQYKSEIEGEWLDGDGTVFNGIRMAAIATPFTGNNTYKGVYMGIDFGAGGGGDSDATALAIFDNTGQMIFLDYFNDLGTFQTVERLLNDIEPFKHNVKWINAEANSIGGPIIDLMLKSANEQGNYRLASVLNKWITSNSSKGKLVTQFQVGLEQGKAKILDEKNLINQLSIYEATYNPKTQVVSYNGANGAHDDLCVCTLLAWDSYVNHCLTTGVYSLGSASMKKH